MNILVIHEVSYLQKVVYEYQEFAEHLAGRGHCVKVIDLDIISENRNSASGVSRTKKGKIELLHTPYINLPGIKLLSAWLLYPAFLRTQILKNKIEVVFLYSVLINGTNTLKVCRKLGLPVLYRCIDVYHKIRNNFWFRWPLFFLEKIVYHRTDLVLTLNEGLKEYVFSLVEKKKEKRVEVLYPGIDTTKFRPAPRDEKLIAELGIRKEARIVIFIGTFYPFSGLDLIAKNIDAVLNVSQEAVFLFVGGGHIYNKLKKYVEKKFLTDRIVLTGFKPFDSMPRYINLSDLAINPFQINAITRHIIPTKLFQYLACGKPVLSTPLPGTIPLLPPEISGTVYCEITDTARFCREIGRLLMAGEEIKKLGKNALSYMEANYSWEKSTEKLESNFIRCIREKSLTRNKTFLTEGL